MAGKGESYKAGRIQPPKGTASVAAGTPTTPTHVHLRGDLAADDGLQAMRARLALSSQRRAELLTTVRQVDRSAQTLETRSDNAHRGAYRVRTPEKRARAFAVRDRLREEARRARESVRAEREELATIPRLPPKLTERYRPILDRLRGAATDGERARASADLRAMRNLRSQQQNRSRLQGDMFAGFSPQARAEHARVTTMRARIARVPELRQQRDQARAQRAARREKSRERKAARAAGRAMGELRSTHAASIASQPSPPKGRHYTADQQGNLSLVKTITRNGGIAVHQADGTGRFNAIDIRSGLSVARFGTREGAEGFARAAGKSIDRNLTRASTGDDRAVRALQKLAKRHTSIDAQRKPSRIVVRTGDVHVDGYRLTGPRVVLRKGAEGAHDTFVQRTRDRGGGWLRFARKPEGQGFWVTRHKTRELAIDGEW